MSPAADPPPTPTPPPALTVVLQAHPLASSYSAALRERTVATLAAAGVDHRVYRLAQGEEPPDEVLTGAERLVLVYPTWSGGLPASLLAWTHTALDRPGVLGSVRELIAITSCGSSKLVNLVQGEWGRDLLRTRLLPACRPGARLRWLPIYKVDRRSTTEMADHLDHVERTLRTWIDRR